MCTQEARDRVRVSSNYQRTYNYTTFHPKSQNVNLMELRFLREFNNHIFNISTPAPKLSNQVGLHIIHTQTYKYKYI